MVIIDAVVRHEGEKVLLDILFPDDTVSIPLSEDNPNRVKSAFNRLISHVRQKTFEVALKELGEDLFSQVANEYVVQLNAEIEEIRAEMQALGLLTAQPADQP